MTTTLLEPNIKLSKPGDHLTSETQGETVSLIRQHYRLWRVYEQHHKSTHLRMCATVRRLTNCKKSESPKIVKECLAGTGYREHYAVLAPFEVSLEPIKPLERFHKKRLEELVESLEIWDQVKDIRGFGAFGCAQIIGEAGDLSRFPNPAKLWKMMCVGLVGDEIQRAYKDKKKAAEHGYSKRRRAVMWNIGESLIKGNGEGKYRTMYLCRKEVERHKAETAGREVRPAAKIPKCSKEDYEAKYMSLGHIHNRARRNVEKELLKDLWIAWANIYGLMPVS